MSELTTEEVAKIFGVSRSALTQWRKRGLVGIEPPRRQRNKGFRYRICDIAAFVPTLDSGFTADQFNKWYEARKNAPEPA